MYTDGDGEFRQESKVEGWSLNGNAHNDRRKATSGSQTKQVCFGHETAYERWGVRRAHFCYRSSRFSKPSMRYLILLVGLLTPSLLAQRTQVPAIPYQSVSDFLKLPPDVYFGEVAGVAVNSKGHVFVFSRGDTTGPAYGSGAAQLLEFGADGKFVREIGHHLYAWSFAHSVKVDKDDNIWVADKGSDMVIKFSPEGRVLMVFGRKQEASDEGTGPLGHPRPPLPPVDGMFRQVTDMAWDAAGNTFISDGYINSRVAKVSKDGVWLKSWGEPGDGPGQFNTPHSIAVDAQDRVYVADRGNRRIQVFDDEGKFLRQITIDVPVDPNARPAIGNKPNATTGAMAPGAPGQSASRRDQVKCYSALTGTRAVSTSSAWTGRC